MQPTPLVRMAGQENLPFRQHRSEGYDPTIDPGCGDWWGTHLDGVIIE